MLAEDLIPKLAAIEEELSERELLPKSRAILELGTASGLSAASIRDWLKVAIEAGVVVVPEMYDRRIYLDGRGKHDDFPPLWVIGRTSRQAEGFSLAREKVDGWGLGQTSFLMSKERCAHLVGAIANEAAKERAEKEAADALRREKRAAAQAEEEAQYAEALRRLYPGVADLLPRLTAALGGAAKHDVMVVEADAEQYASITLAFNHKSFPAFERIVRAGLAATEEGKSNG